MPACVQISPSTLQGNNLLVINNDEEYPDCSEGVLYFVGEGNIIPPLSIEDAATLGGAIALALVAAFGFRILYKMRITSD